MTEIRGKYKVDGEEEIKENHSLKKLIIFDKDSLMESLVSGNIQSPINQKIRPGAGEAIQSFYRRGFSVAVVSNQPQVEAGEKSLESAIAEMQFCLNLMDIDFGVIAHTFEGKSAWKLGKIYRGEIWDNFGKFGSFLKPSPGMINFLIQFYGSSPSQTWLISDDTEDAKTAEAAGSNFLAGDLVRARYLPGWSELQISVDDLGLVDPDIKAIYRV